MPFFAGKYLPFTYEEVWDDFKDCMGIISDTLAKGTNLDVNNDGRYTGEEAKELLCAIKDEFVSVSNEAIKLANELERLSENISIPINSKKSGHSCIKCTKEALQVFISPFSGEIEYYCDQHYLEFINTLNKKKDDEKKSKQSKCQADGCYNDAEYTVMGIVKEENYCKKHYDEMMAVISMMEEDVGSGKYSQHLCESCSKEGTNAVIGLSGKTEYYCTEHYNEMIEILNGMISN